MRHRSALLSQQLKLRQKSRDVATIWNSRSCGEDSEYNICIISRSRSVDSLVNQGDKTNSRYYIRPLQGWRRSFGKSFFQEWYHGMYLRNKKKSVGTGVELNVSDGDNWS